MTAVTAVMIGHNNEDRFLPRLAGLLRALRHCGLDAELIVIDNSAARSERIAAAVTENAGRYCWQGGVNLMYGPAMNVAVKLARRPYLIYVCANHGHSRDPSWPSDLLAPLLADDRVAMTGCLQPSGAPQELGFPADLPPVHVQGGVMAARTSVLREYPYPNGELAHWGSDVYQSLRLMAAGWKLVDVPEIRSVWQEELGEGDWKYVHRGG